MLNNGLKWGLLFLPDRGGAQSQSPGRGHGPAPRGRHTPGQGPGPDPLSRIESPGLTPNPSPRQNLCPSKYDIS